MPYRTNLGLVLGQSLGGLGAALAGGGRGGQNDGRSAAFQDFAMEARGKESLADAALKQRQTAPSAEEMALNEVGAVGSVRDMLLKASRGEPVTSEIPQQLLQSFLKGKNAYSSVEPSNFEQIQKGLGANQENNLVKNIAESGYNSDIGKALLLAKGKAPFAGGTYNATDLTTGAQGINPLGQSVIGLNQDKGKQALAGAALDYSGIDENQAQIRKINHGMNMDELDFTRKNSEFDRELDFKGKQAALKSKGEPGSVGFSYEKLPANHKMVYAKNSSALNQIDRAIKAIEQRPESLGFINVLGDNISQRRDPDGVSVRSAVSGIGGIKLHDLSGAAISPSESKRLMPLIPMATDTPEAAVEKLKQLKAEYADINTQIETMYSGGGGGATETWQKPDDWEQFLQETGQK
jgi:hypothetical protein